MHHACHRRAATTFDIGDRARNGACGRHAAKERRDKIGHTLRHEFLIGVVPVANEAIGNASTQQRLNGAQQS